MKESLQEIAEGIDWTKISDPKESEIGLLISTGSASLENFYLDNHTIHLAGELIVKNEQLRHRLELVKKHGLLIGNLKYIFRRRRNTNVRSKN